MTPRPALSLVTLLLGACAVGPDYHRPSLDVPAAFRGAQAGADKASAGDASWRTIYTDEQLQQLIAGALRSNLDLKVAVARIDEVRATLGVSRLALAPTIDAAGNLSRSRTSADARLPGQPAISNVEYVDVNVSWEIDFWGRLRRANEAARAQLLSTEYARHAVEVSLIANVATAYYSLLALDSELEITKRTVATRETFVGLTRAQHERGYATGLDVATAEAQAAVARANVPELERQIGTLENLICLLLGENPHPVVRRQRSEDMPEALPLPPPGLPSDLLERRPDLRAAEESLRAANANVGAARAALFPTISLTGLAGSLSSPLGDLFRAPTREWSAAVGVLQPLLNPQRSLYQVDIADARKREALYQYQSVVQTAFSEVANALLNYEKYAAFEREQVLQVDALRRARAIAVARYRVGYASYFDVINADRDLFTAELTLSQAYANSLNSVVRLYQVLGGGWQDPATAAR